MSPPLALGSPAQLSNKAFNASPAECRPPFGQKLSSPFTPAAAYTTNASPKGLFGSPVHMQHHVTPPAAKAPASQQQTPDCPPPVLLGADSVPRFPTPQYSPAYPRTSPASPLPEDSRGRTTDKGRSVLGSLRLRSKSRSGRERTTPEERKPAQPARERRFSISDRISSVLKRKPKAEQETPPPLPTASRVKVSASASSTKLAVQATPQRSLARSASSPNLSRKQSWQIESRLPPLPAFGEAFAGVASTYQSPVLGLRPSFHTPPIDTSVRRPTSTEPESPTSVPSLSPSSSQSVSFGASTSNLHTPSLPSPAFFPDGEDSPAREVLQFYPFGSPLDEHIHGQQVSLTATPQQMAATNGSTFESPRTGASDDIPLAMLKLRREQQAARPAPFQFVSAEMSKKPLKKGRSTPNLRAEPFRRPPSLPAAPYLGHSLLPQSDDGVKARVGGSRPLPVFVEQSVLALAT